MLKAYAAASEEDILRDLREFKLVFDSMLGQTMECAVFISEYSSKSYKGEQLGFFASTLAITLLQGRFFTRRVTEKIAQFCDSFADLEKQFHNRMVRKTAVVSLGTYSSVKFIGQSAFTGRN